MFNPFWQHHNGIGGYEDWEERFRASQRRFARALRARDTVEVLSLVFDRLYVLRNQLVHGGATWNSRVNRDQVRDGAAILAFLMPVFVDVMMDNPGEDWGRPFYPVVQSGPAPTGSAHASETWTAEELRGAYERQAEARGGDAEAELAALLQTDGDPDVDGFWAAVSTNLAAKRLRLLFVADFIPDPLARVVEFLNAQMPGIEVLAVEIKRFHGTSAQTLVPRVIGRTAAPGAWGRGWPGHRLTRESFLDGFENDAVRGVAARLLDAAVQSGADIWYGAKFGLSIRARCSDWPRPISIAWLYSQPGKGWMRTRDFSFGAAVYDHAHPEELRAMLERWFDEVSADSIAEDVSSKGVKAWAVRHEVGVQHQDVLVERLQRIISELAPL